MLHLEANGIYLHVHTDDNAMDKFLNLDVIEMCERCVCLVGPMG